MHRALCYRSRELNGQILALLHESSVIGEGTRIDIWNQALGKRIRVLHAPDKEALQPGLAFTPDGRRMVALFRGASDTAADQITEYETANWSIEWGLKTAPFWPSVVAVSPDGKLAALGGAVGVYQHAPVWLIDLNAHRIVQKIDAFPSDSVVAGLSFSPDGKRLAASASFNNVYPTAENLKIFSVSSGDRITATVSPDQSQTGLAYAGDGAYLVEGAIYGTRPSGMGRSRGRCKRSMLSWAFLQFHPAATFSPWRRKPACRFGSLDKAQIMFCVDDYHRQSFPPIMGVFLASGRVTAMCPLLTNATGGYRAGQ